MSFSQFAPAITGLAGIIVGAWVQHFYSQRLEERRQLRELRARARRDLSDAKARAAIYGSPEIVAAMAAFLRDHQSLGPAATAALIRLAVAMRQVMARTDIAGSSTETHPAATPLPPMISR